MKLIIDIPIGYYKLQEVQNGSIANKVILKAVKNGKPYEERPQGEWILPNFYDDGVSYECNKCHVPHEGYIGKDDKPHGYDFCPNCGASMTKGEKGGKENG